MSHVPSLRTSCALVLFSALSAACKVKDPLYCDQNTPCTDPALPFCDLNGEYSASEGIKRTCIPYPWDAAPDTDAAPACTPGEWTLDTIDDGDIRTETALAIDSYGVIHVAYAVGDPPVLYYASGRPGVWTTMETPESGGSYPQIAVDSSDVIHLVHGGWPGGLRYLHKALADDQFEYELVAPEQAFDIGFDLDPSDKPVACFLDGQAGGPPKCHKETIDGWNAIESPGTDTKSGIAIATDVSNNLHMIADGLVYTYWDGNQWSSEEAIEDNADVYASLAVDSEGVPHLTYTLHSTGYSYGDVVHAYRAGPNDWVTETAETAVDGRSPSIAVDADDVLHIAYVDRTNSNLKYARRDGDRWSTQTIDTSATDPGIPRIVVDRRGTPHIVYYDQNDRDLRYAYLCP